MEFEPKLIRAGSNGSPPEQVYDVLAERYQSGESEVAARHNEHQPGSQ